MTDKNIFIHPEYLKRLSEDRQCYWLSKTLKHQKTLKYQDTDSVFPIFEYIDNYGHQMCCYVGVDMNSDQFNKLFVCREYNSDINRISLVESGYGTHEQKIIDRHIVDIGG
jgi:hypothetical protein